MRRGSPVRHAFTLIELLLVIAIIALLVSILLPALRAARESGRATQCLSNSRSLAQAMTLYSGDFKDALVSSWTDSRLHPSSWVDWPRSETGSYLSTAQLNAATTVDSHIRGVQAGALFPFAEDWRAYHCPTDARDRYRTNAGANLAWVTYSMPNFLFGDDSWEDQIGGGRRTVRRLSQLWRPADTFAFLEEADPRGLNMGSWIMRLDIPQWIDPLTVWHDDAANVGFGDGHAAGRKWQDRRTVRMSRDQQFYADASNNPDYRWLRERWWNP
ncbi:MAG: prepilin-type N-terminal cleavage/methylation domain-containing protein [Phycisphaerales bacterium]